jgi:hypothetical protein
MINIFKALNTLNILWLAIVLVVLRAGCFFYVPAKFGFEFSGPFARLLMPAVNEYPFSPGLNIVFASAMVFIQALLINHLVNYYNLLGKPTLLPALMYITISSLFTPFLVLGPALVCNFLIIWMVFKLFNLYKSKDAKTTAFDLGMIIAAGSIIYLPFAYLLLVAWSGLIIFRPLYWREFLAIIIGYVTIFFFLAVYYYINNSISQFYEIWASIAVKPQGNIILNYYNYLVLVPVVIILMLCFAKLQQNFFRSYVQTRKSFQLILFLFLIAALTFYVKAAVGINHFLLCGVPAAIFFSYYFLNAKLKWFYETLYLVLFLAVIYFQFNTF